MSCWSSPVEDQETGDVSFVDLLRSVPPVSNYYQFSGMYCHLSPQLVCDDETLSGTERETRVNRPSF